MLTSMTRWYAATLIAALALSMNARAQDEAPPEERPRKRGWFDWGGGNKQAERPQKPAVNPQMRRALARPQSFAVPMVVSAGKLYLVVGNAVKKLDAQTLDEEETAVIPMENTERVINAQHSYLVRFDTNKDGKVTRDEAPRPEWIDKLDRNQDGAVTIDEVPLPRAATAAMGPATLLVEAGSLYVYTGNTLLRYKTDPLTLMAQTTVTGPGRPGAARKLGPGGRQPGAARRRDLPPPQEEPIEEPLKF